MKRWIKSAAHALAAAALALAGLLCLAGPPAMAQTTDEIVQRGKILVAIDTNNPPWGFLDSGMQPEGIDVATARLLAKYMGVQLEIVPVTSQNRIPFILTGKADLVMATLTVTPPRALQIWFSNPYAAQESIIMAPAATKLESYADLKGKKVSVVRGAIQDPLVVARAPEAQMMRFDSDASTIQALMTRQVDATATGFLIPAQTNKLQPGANYEKKLSLGWQHIAIGLKKGNSDLLRWVNTFVYHTRNNGELNEIFKKYAGVDLPELPSY